MGPKVRRLATRPRRNGESRGMIWRCQAKLYRPAGRHDGPRAASRRIELLAETSKIVERRTARGVAAVDVSHQIGVHDAPV